MCVTPSATSWSPTGQEEKVQEEDECVWGRGGVTLHANGFSLVFEWLQVSLSLFSILTDVNNAVVWMVSTHLLISKSLYQSFGDCIKRSNYSWYNRHLLVPHFVQFPSKVLVLVLLFAFFQFYSVVNRGSKVHSFASSLFFFFFLFFFADYYKLFVDYYNLLQGTNS